MASFKTRVQAAVEVFRNGYPWVGTRRGEKAAPFMVWPSYWQGEPQWRMVDLQTYIEEGFDMNTLVYSAVMFKARSAIQAPLRAYQGDEDDGRFLAKEHPLTRLCTRPNPSQSWREFQQAQTMFLNLTGDALTWFDRRGAEQGVPNAMYVLNPLQTHIVPGGKGQIKGYWFVPQGKAMVEGYPLLTEDVSHVKLPNPGDPLDGEGYGLSPLQPLAYSADVDNMITRFLHLFFERGAIPAGTLRFEVGLDDATIGNIKARWRELYGGYENWTEIGVIDNGGEYQRVGMTFEELGFESLDERNESRVLGPFGVPPILIGSRLGLMRSTYANYAEARQGFWEDTMTSELLLHQDDYQHYLTSEDGGRVAFDFAKVPALRKDVEKQVTAWRGLVEYGVPKARAARVTGLNLGSLADGEVSYMAGTLVESRAQTPPAQDTSNKENPEAEALDRLTIELKRANDLLEASE